MPDQCRAVTEGGERCSRPAKENGFCHQHGPENETVDEADAAETTDAEEDDEREDSNVPEDTDSEEETESEDSTEPEHDGDTENGDESESTSEAESQEETESAESEPETDSGSDSDEPSTIVTVRNRVRDQVPQLIGRQLDGVTSLRRGEDGWVATVELIERRSVPDTQDILGQYEVSLTDDGVIHEYRRLETYRRADGAEYQT